MFPRREYAYDFAGNRIAKIGEISTTYYLVDTNGALSQVLAEYDENGTLSLLHGLIRCSREYYATQFNIQIQNN